MVPFFLNFGLEMDEKLSVFGLEMDEKLSVFGLEMIVNMYLCV